MNRLINRVIINRMIMNHLKINESQKIDLLILNNNIITY